MRILTTTLAVTLALFICNPARTQDNLVNIGGIVLNEDSGDPVPGQLVQTVLSAGGTVQQFDLFTNESGIFHKDSIVVTGPAWVVATTLDCNGVPHSLDDSLSPGNYSPWFELSICSDSSEPCQAFFNYDLPPGPALEVQFTDLSTGSYTDQLWSFGDGSFSSGSDPLHPYENPGTYEACLTIWSSDSTCMDQYCLEVIVPGDSLECWNFFSYETWNLVDFTFNGESYPNAASSYFWDFGDGSTGWGQTVFHTYGPLPNSVTVVLTTLSYDPAAGDTCMAVSSQYMMTGNGDCMADFTAEPDPGNSLLIAFTDNSSGPVTQYQWDFGDGGSSVEKDPMHLYEAPGVYTVCLTIQADTLGYICTDSVCMEIAANFTLSAGYTAVLDTAGGASGTFHFTDNTTGDPDTWSWDFGDGQQSSVQNPVHQYAESGTYEVCLVAGRNFPGGDYYEDQYCQTLVSPQYFDLGGQVYLGSTPMNNFNGDTTTVDAGIAYLYRKYENVLIPADTQYFATLGYYWFSDVMEGDYLVRVRLTGDSEHYGEYLPGYHQQALRWQDAATVSIGGADLYTEDLHLSPGQDPGTGAGSISGYAMYSGGNTILIENLDGLDVFLLDEQMTPLGFCATDIEGAFTFGGLPPGIYTLYPEVPGMFTNPVVVEITDQEEIVTGIALGIFEQALGIENPPDAALSAGQVYPNPVKDRLSIDLTETTRTGLVFTVYSITGQKLLEKTGITMEKTGTCTFDVGEIPSGMFILTITMPDKNERLIRKFVK